MNIFKKKITEIQIPICPNCNKGTKRRYLYNTEKYDNQKNTYDENGKLIPRGYHEGEVWKCLNCNEWWTVWIS